MVNSSLKTIPAMVSSFCSATLGFSARLGADCDTLNLSSLLMQAGCRKLPRPWHALRHTFASHFIMSGDNILSLQKILGHSDIKMTLIYAHLGPDFLGDEMNKVRYR